MCKKRFKLFVCICFAIVMFVGCKEEKSNYTGGTSLETQDSQNTDFNDVPEADMDAISKTNKQLPSPKPLVNNNSQIVMNAKNENNILAIEIENKSDDEIFFGGRYILYRYNDNEWENIEYLPGVGVKDIQYIVRKDEIFSDEIKLLNIFGELKNGKYKIQKEIELTDSRIIVSAEFEIK